MPGGAIDVYTSGEKLPQAAAQALIQRFGLDKPVLTQFALYLKNTFTGEFGLSFFYYPKPVSALIKKALPWSLFLIITAEVLTVPIGYFLGVVAGWKPGSKRDSTIQAASLAILATPLFWIAMIFLFIFSFILGWFPLAGAQTVGAEYANWLEHLGDIIWHAVLPILSLATAFGAYELIMRNTMITTLREHYVLTAEAKGLSENAVKYRHAARNALLPMVTSAILGFAMAVSGSVYVETIFSYPGIGRLMYNSIMQRDYPVLQGGFLVYSVVMVAAVFLLDVIYMRLDPRIRF
jgi:peptide/nickel transport system permease protein